MFTIATKPNCRECSGARKNHKTLHQPGAVHRMDRRQTQMNDNPLTSGPRRTKKSKSSRNSKSNEGNIPSKDYQMPFFSSSLLTHTLLRLSNWISWMMRCTVQSLLSLLEERNDYVCILFYEHTGTES